MINLLLPLDLQYFAEEQPSADAPETNPVEQPVDNTNPESSDTPVEDVKTVTMTQKELDELIVRAKGQVKKKFADYDEIKTKASEYEAQLEAKRLSELSEVEKAQEQARKFEEQLTSLTAQLEAERTKAQQQAIKNEFIKVASSANIIDIDAAIALSDLSAVSLGENGAVVGVDDVIKTLVENKPYLVAKKTTQPIGSATNAGQSTDKSAEQLLADAAEKARTGTIKDRVAYAQLKKQFGK